MTGGRTAAPIWADIFEKVYATRDDWRMEFEAPTGIETVDICGHTGKLTSTICAQYHPAEVYKAVPYRLGAAPTEKCNDVPRKPIVERFAPPRVRLPGTPPPPGGVMKPFGGSLKGRSP
jgi:membrane carboxypeptidase/penicillin-binding protein